MLAMKLLAQFTPWIVFWMISSLQTMISVQIGICIAAVLVLIMGIKGVHRGLILWAGMLFFGFALVFVVGLRNLWFIHHLGILASGTLFTMTLMSILVRRPFTMTYAAEAVAPELRQTPAFLRSCYVTTGLWTLVFLGNTLLNIAKLLYPDVDHLYFLGLELGLILLGVVLTTLYAGHAKRRRLAQQTERP